MVPRLFTPAKIRTETRIMLQPTRLASRVGKQEEQTRRVPMTVLRLSEAADAWDLLKGGRGTGPVLIFAAAADPDALAAVRTLTALLRADLVRYEVHPVSGYGHLARIFRVLLAGNGNVEPRAVLCVNCGAKVDLERVLRLREGLMGVGVEDEGDTGIVESDVSVFVIDSHRPYHLKNVNSERVFLFDDDDLFSHADLPLDVDWEDEWGNVSDHDLSDDDSLAASSGGSGYEGSSSESDFESEGAVGNEGSDDGAARSGGEEDEVEDGQSVAESQGDDSDKRKPFLSLGKEKKTAKAKRQRPVRENAQNKHRQGPGTAASPGTDEDDDDDLDTESGDDGVGGDGVEDTLATEEDVVVFDNEDDHVGGTDPETEEPREGTGRARRKRTRSLQRGEYAQRKKTSGRRQRRKRQKPRRRVDPEVAEKEALRDYYANSTLAMSSACLSHNLASTMRRSDLATLWMAIVGVTSQYLVAAVPEDLYKDAVAYFRTQIASLSPVVGSRGGAEESRQENVGYAAVCSEQVTQSLSSSTELRLDLVRHWTLYDSLLYSSYTITRLAAWRQTGKRRLLELLATLGIPLKESKQKWCYMRSECKSALDNRLTRVINRFDLGQDIQYDSFVRTMPGHRGSMSAADVVHGISALLELDNSGVADRAGRARSSLQDRFWRAYDALDPRRTSLLESGLDLAIMAQKLAADIGGDVIERRKFVPSGPFRYVFLRDQQCKEILAHPLLLRRLALFLIDALARQGAKDKPFIVLAPDVARSVWLAVATTTVGQQDDFGHRFQRAAERNGSQIVYDGFDSAVCEIQDGQEIEFVRFLHDIMR